MRYTVLVLLALTSLRLPASTPDTLRPGLPAAATAYDPIIEALDSMVSAMFFSTEGLYPYRALEPADGNTSISFIPDSVFRYRMDALDRRTPIGMVYNRDVRQYIELYGGSRFQQMQRMMGVAYMYFPLFEAALDRYNVPLELKYLAIVESALNPTAVSRAGAKGLWQFMYQTGKLYGLEVNSVVDDRFDPIKASDAAARHLRDLHNIFGDWSLALAAYNAGAGNVTRAIRRAGGVMDYWAVRPYLPKETRGYVPAFLAVTYLLENAAQHGLKPVKPALFFQQTDTVVVTDLLRFRQISEVTGIPIETLRLLNPSFVKDVIPAGLGKTYAITLPRTHIATYVAMEDSLYRYNVKEPVVVQEIAAMQAPVEETRKYHTVKRGESLGSIASRYGVSVNNLKSWNNLRSTKIYPKQRLVIRGKAGNTSLAQSSPRPEPVSASALTHTVKRGESLGIISGLYKIDIEDLKQWNGLSSNTLHPGQVLKVRAPEETPALASEEKAETPSPAPVTQGLLSNKAFITYTVQAGDTLWSIAKRFEGVSVDDIRNANDIKAVHELKPGQVLKVPVKA
ncbi:MAG TPA: LysM peptidoglycan-binding domain-containing protein [Bacteroidales bacterium]|nr:LysM peptidoglycan-binding domain-containing protein [Bacteroidales bacterium]